MSNAEGPIVGIDLGTTNSVVAVVIDGQPMVLEENGEKILPSIVGFNGQRQLITGVVARNQLAAFPERTIASIKRKMGSMEPVKLWDQSFTPPEISAMILRRLKDRASQALGRPVTRAVITVPAFFDEQQRQATREAGELAGLKVERIINEPTAATLVYHAKDTGRRHIVVYDFGGGTFDVSIVRMESGVIEVLTSKGDTHLGGDDLDNALLDYIADAFYEQHLVDLRKEPMSRFRMLQACEQAKCKLSTDESVRIVEEFIATHDGDPLHLDVTVSRGLFERLITPFIDQTIDCLDEALRDVNMSIGQIDDLVLVGGSTRIPMVAERLRSDFQCEPSRSVDPDLAVALGAAVQGAIIEGKSVNKVLVDVTTHTLGLEVLEDVSFTSSRAIATPIIHRNTPLPARYEESYYTCHENQEKAEIHVLQGESKLVEENRSIGKFMLDLKTGGEANRKIVVRFVLTLDGTLEVTATQSVTGISKKLTIDNALSQFQSEDRTRASERLGSIFDASDEFYDDDEEFAAAKAAFSDEEVTPRSELRRDDADFSTRFPHAVNLMRKADMLKASVSVEDAQEMEDLKERIEEAMAAGDDVVVASLCEQLDDILFYVQ